MGRTGNGCSGRGETLTQTLIFSYLASDRHSPVSTVSSCHETLLGFKVGDELGGLAFSSVYQPGGNVAFSKNARPPSCFLETRM